MDATSTTALAWRPRRANRTARLHRIDVEGFLERQRDQLPLWLPVMLGTGIAAWFALPGPAGWIGWLLAMAAISVAALLFARSGRLRRVLLIAALASAAGCGLAWLRAISVAAPVLTRPVVVQMIADVERIEVQTAKERVRLTLRPVEAPALPPRIRVNVDHTDLPVPVAAGDRLSLRARLMPPAIAAVPGGFDFARVAWFQRLGATGTALGRVTITQAGERSSELRERLSAHVRMQLSGSAGGIAAAFASGDRGGIAVEDEEAMRASGLTHLLSISGLHVTAVVGATMLLTLRLLALSPWLAFRLPLIVIAAGAGAAVGVGYTLLTGAEVPTIRSCIAAVLILLGVALGRRAFTLRLVATGAFAVLLVWPEALVGPSFQLSFAAITAIVALHEWPLMQALTQARDEGILTKVGRNLLSLLLTGIIVEVALAPIALFHFHRQGLYGALANIVAIPLTTFVTMPLEALALVFDLVGIGRPFWWLTGLSLELLLWIARVVAAWPGAVAALPSVPIAAFAAIIGGGLWLTLWQGNVRLLGLLPALAGSALAIAAPDPDLLITGDGKHLAVRATDGSMAILRPRAGDYVRSMLSERSGEIGELADLDIAAGARCSTDVCRIDLLRGGRHWRIVATRSRYLLPIATFVAECRAADIVISDRRLPRTCTPRWLKIDRDLLARTGGVAISLASARVETVAMDERGHPWNPNRPTAEQQAQYRRNSPASRP